MSDFFDRLGAAAKRAASSVATDVSVAAEEQKIRECYQALGKLYFQSTRKGVEPSGADFAEQCRKIEERLKRINELKNRQDVTGGYSERDDFVDLE